MSERAQEAPRDKAELDARVDALWHEELEWVRRHPDHGLARFRALIEKETRKNNVNKLPPLDIAMWPLDVFCDIDVSNPEKFNDRFIELPVENRASGYEKIFWGFHNGMTLFLLVVWMFSNQKPLSMVFFYLTILAVSAPLIYFFTFKSGKNKLGRTRYNRQAQLVHIDNGKGHTAHIPWRHVVPLVDAGIAPASILRTSAPRPRAEDEAFNLRVLFMNGSRNEKHMVDGLYGVNITFFQEDHVSTHGNLQRLEFVRRYMEHGIQAIQPHPEAVALGLIKDSAEFDDPKRVRALGWDGKYIFYPLGRILHYFCFGPWLDKRARYRRDGFEWNDEVKNLCGPNPDLRGLNTRPVKSHTDVYYRPDGASYRLVDRHGNALRFNQNQARRA